MKYLIALLTFFALSANAEQHWFDSMPLVGELDFFENSTNYQETGYIRGIGKREYSPQGVYHEMNFTNPGSRWYLMGGASHDRDRTADTSLVYGRLGYAWPVGKRGLTNAYAELGPTWIEADAVNEDNDSSYDASIELGVITHLVEGNTISIGLQYAEYGLEYTTVDPLLLKLGYSWGTSE